VLNSSLAIEPVFSDERDALRAGGTETLAVHFEEYRDRLERMVNFRLDARLLGRIDPADVVQEAYIEASRRIDSYVSAAHVSLFVWLRQITWQVLMDTHRRHLRQKRNAGQEVSLQANDDGRDYLTGSPLADRLAGDLTSPSQAAMRNERLVLLRDALSEMDDLDREILALRHFEQLSGGGVIEPHEDGGEQSLHASLEATAGRSFLVVGLASSLILELVGRHATKKPRTRTGIP
jgi:RNA polymerase sigma-70 factor (ECF subfamily)